MKTLAFTCLVALLANLSLPGFAYDRQARANYYASKEFQKDIDKYCDFEAEIVAQSQIPIPSREFGRKAIGRVADLDYKVKHFSDIDPSRSYKVFEGNDQVGPVYHFRYRENRSQLFSFRSGKVADQYPLVRQDDRYESCTVYTTTNARHAVVEYSIVESGGQVYLRRTSRLVPGSKPFLVPDALIETFSEKANRDILRDLARQVRLSEPKPGELDLKANHAN